jgi:hypothetical protein
MSTNELVTLGPELVECTTSLEQRLVDTSTTSNDADSGTSTARDRLLGTRWETDTCLSILRRMADDGGVVARSAGECSSVSNLLLDVADDRTLRALREREDVANGERSTLAGVDKSTSVEALGGDEGLGAKLVAVRVAEDDAGERGATMRELDYGFEYIIAERTVQRRE